MATYRTDPEPPMDTRYIEFKLLRQSWQETIRYGHYVVKYLCTNRHLSFCERKWCHRRAIPIQNRYSVDTGLYSEIWKMKIHNINCVFYCQFCYIQNTGKASGLSFKWNSRLLYFINQSQNEFFFMFLHLCHLWQTYFS